MDPTINLEIIGECNKGILKLNQTFFPWCYIHQINSEIDDAKEMLDNILI